MKDAFDTPSSKNRKRLSAELRKIVELLWICECNV